MRVLYFGMNGAFSYPPLAKIVQAQGSGGMDWLEVAAVILPASAVPQVQMRDPIRLLPPERPKSDLPMLQPYMEANIIHLAWANNIPVYLVKGMGDEAVRSLFVEIGPAIACVACFPFRIPSSILAIPKYGFLNVHPSLLPDYRGPSPLFWIFRDGAQAGVTVHWMDEGLDSGDILSQRPLLLPDGISGPEADRLCATMGGEMLLAGLEQIRAGKVARRPQPVGGSQQPWPTDEAFVIEQSWSAQRAFNFMRGTAEWNRPYSVNVGDRTLTLVRAESFDMEQVLAEPVVERDGRLTIQFSPGVLAAV